MRAELEAARADARKRAIQTSGEIVGDLSARLSSAANVPPRTVANVLDVALKIYSEAERSTGRDENLVEVDIRTSLAESHVSLGEFGQARAELARAEVVRLQPGVCDQQSGNDSSVACHLRALRIWRLLGEVVLAERPHLQARIVETYQAIGANALQPLEQHTAVAAMALDPSLRQGYETIGQSHDLFIGYHRTRAIQARLLRQLASLEENVTLEAAQRRNLLATALGITDDCVQRLQPPKGAKEGDIGAILGTGGSASSDTSRDPERRKAERTARATCLLEKSAIAVEQANRAVASPDAFLATATEAADAAAADMSAIASSDDNNLPMQLLHLRAQVERGLLLAPTSERARGELVEALDRFLTLAARDFEHHGLERALLQFADRIRESLGPTSWSGALLNKLGLPERTRVETLSRGITALIGRIAALQSRPAGVTRHSPRIETALATLRAEHPQRVKAVELIGAAGSMVSEAEAAKQELASFAAPLLAMLHKAGNNAETTRQYETIAKSLPVIVDSTLSSSPVFQNVLSIKFWAGKAYRAQSNEAEAIDRFYEISRVVIGRVKKADQTGDTAALLRYLHAYSIKELGGIRVLEIDDGSILDERLAKAFEQVNEAQTTDSGNIEFQFALGSVLYNQARRDLQRGLNDEAIKKLERARNFGSDDAANLLISWARSGTGPDSKVDFERAERLTRERSESTPLKYAVKGKSRIFSEAEDRFEIYIKQPRESVDVQIERERKRLRDYYGVETIEQADLSALRNIFLRAREAVGNDAAITKRELEVASMRIIFEQNDTRPYGSGPLSEALSRTDTLMKDEDYGRARDNLENAQRALSEVITTPDDVSNWGMLALHYLKLAERTTAPSRPQDYDPEFVRRVKAASQYALTRATDYRELAVAAGKNENVSTALHNALARLAGRARELYRSLPRALSYETNKSYNLYLNELARNFQDRAIAILDEKSNKSARDATDVTLETLVRARLQMAGYAIDGVSAMEDGNEELQSVKTRLFTKAMRELSSAYSIVEELVKRAPQKPYFLDRQRIQKAVAEVHDAFAEHQVALRLISEAIQDTSTLINSNPEDVALRTIQAENHELLARIAFKLGISRINDVRKATSELKLQLSNTLYVTIKKPQDNTIPSFLRTAYLEAASYIDQARESFDLAAQIREKILAVEPDHFCACKVNENVRLLITAARLQSYYDLPRRDGLPSVDEYLEKRITEWRNRAKDDVNPDSTRFARWYLARSYALRDDIRRQDGTTANLYIEADEEFRKIKSPSNEMLADHALLLSDKAFTYLLSGFDGLLSAERSINEAYEIWLKLPYAIWLQIEQSDLNIPANYAHVRYLKGLGESTDKSVSKNQALSIYRKYLFHRLERGATATWSDLVSSDLKTLKDRAAIHPAYDAIEIPDFIAQSVTKSD